jgi:hypothetical protein
MFRWNQGLGWSLTSGRRRRRWKRVCERRESELRTRDFESVARISASLFAQCQMRA